SLVSIFSRTRTGMVSAFPSTSRAATGAIGACMSALIAPSNKIGAGSENFPPHAPPRPASQKQDDYSFYFLDSIYCRSAPPAHEPAQKGAFGAGGRLGRVFLYSAQKKFRGRLWSKAGPASPIPHLGLCKLNPSMSQAVDQNRRCF